VTATAPYGTWRSPIDAALIAGASIGLDSPRVVGSSLFWIELRPGEGGRHALVEQTGDGTTRDVVSPPWNVRTRVHEYGGVAYAVADGVVYASHFADQRLYRITPGAEPVAITPEAPLRYADGVIDGARGRWLGVVEDHRCDGEPRNLIAAVSLGDGSLQPLIEGHDFVAGPRLSPDGTRLAWIAWNHPNMPWDGTELWVASIGDDGRPARAERIAGGDDESIVQPTWSPDGVLHFASDRSGHWNLYRWRDGEAQPLCPMEAEFAAPPWMLGRASFGFSSASEIICAYSRDGGWQLARLAVQSGELRDLDTPYSTISGLDVGADRVLFIGGAPTRPTAVVELDLATGQTRELRRSFELTFDAGYVSVPEAITFPTTGGAEAHAFFYPPANPDVTAPEGERPPLLVFSHGGPTSATSSALRLGVQYWTSRGFAVVDVNYRGSTGYGRAYRNALRGTWGVADVDDCCAAATYLADGGRVDPARLAIRGGSAGGYTTLCALAFRDRFAAGASHFGVSDLAAMARDTHKFESRYLDGLIGPYPEREDLYRERSPLAHADRIRCPVIFLQGLDDKVVPPDQSELMVRALRGGGVPVAYVAFEGEQHGFRQASSIRRSLEAELYFYGRIFGFAPADPIEPVDIANL
jgi:dipeptidyl aminopeptidase/acylaminoacyl peptidase